MNSTTAWRLARWIVAFLIVAIVGALLGWYTFLRGSTNATNAVATARGLGANVPAFSGTTGSTQQNIAATVQGESAPSANASSTYSGKHLWEVSNTPVAGADFNGTTTLQYVAQATGYVFTADPKSHGVVRLTNTLRPKVYDAYVAPGGYVVERSIESTGEVTAFVARVASSTATSTVDGALSGTYLNGHIDALAVNPATHMLLYTLQQGDGSAYGMLSDWSTTKQKRLFETPLTQWRLWYLPDGSIVVAQKPADGYEGYAYRVDGKTGAFAPLVSGEGLTVLPRASSTAMLFGTSSGGVLALFAQASAKSSASALPLTTVADKCVWAPGTALVAYCAVPSSVVSNTFLDDWYRGTLHTTDTWWTVNALTGSSTPLFATTSSDPQLDVKNPVIDPTGSYIAFENASDGTLWLLTLPH
jgi:hypothetical protein